MEAGDKLMGTRTFDRQSTKDSQFFLPTICLPQIPSAIILGGKQEGARLFERNIFSWKVNIN